MTASAKRPVRRLKVKEADIQRTIFEALRALGVWCWRANSGMQMATYKGRKRRILMSPPGTPDILGVLPGGRLFGLEVKSSVGKQSESQEAWQLKAERHGVLYAVVRSAGEAVALIKEWRK